MAKAGVYQARSRNPDIIAARFWAKVQKGDGCWEWQGSRQKRGYGLFRIKGRLHKAHRAALMVSGVEVPDDLCVLHSCDNPPCCNPAHLRLGTKGENNTERHAKGRTVLPVWCRGESSAQAKLTKADVLEMRRLWDAGLTCAAIAEGRSVGTRHVWDVVNRRCWNHI